MLRRAGPTPTGRTLPPVGPLPLISPFRRLRGMGLGLWPRLAGYTVGVSIYTTWAGYTPGGGPGPIAQDLSAKYRRFWASASQEGGHPGPPSLLRRSLGEAGRPMGLSAHGPFQLFSGYMRRPFPPAETTFTRPYRVIWVLPRVARWLSDRLSD